MERKENWYSIIQFMPSLTRGEKINIGLILHEPETGSLIYQVLENTNTKIKSLALNKVLEDTYKVQKDYFDYFLEKLKNEDPSLDRPNIFSKDFLLKLNDHLPDEWKVSDPAYCKPSNKEVFFKELLNNYIGREYLSQTEDTVSVTIKNKVKDSFTRNNLLNTKVKQNARVRPIKELDNIQYTVDFIYKNGIYNFMQAIPSNIERINDWYAKLNTLLDAYKNDVGFYIFYDNNSETNEDFQGIIKHLKSNHRITSIKIDSDEFISLCERIDKEGKNIDDFDAEYLIS